MKTTLKLIDQAIDAAAPHDEFRGDIKSEIIRLINAGGDLKEYGKSLTLEDKPIGLDADKSDHDEWASYAGKVDEAFSELSRSLDHPDNQKYIILCHGRGDYITSLNDKGEVGGGSAEDAIEYTEDEAREVMAGLGSSGFSMERSLLA